MCNKTHSQKEALLRAVRRGDTVAAHSANKVWHNVDRRGKFAAPTVTAIVSVSQNRECQQWHQQLKRQRRQRQDARRRQGDGGDWICFNVAFDPFGK